MPEVDSAAAVVGDPVVVDPDGLPIFAPGASWPAYSWEFADDCEPRDGDASDEAEAAYYAERGEG